MWSYSTLGCSCCTSIKGTTATTDDYHIYEAPTTTFEYRLFTDYAAAGVSVDAAKGTMSFDLTAAGSSAPLYVSGYNRFDDDAENG